MARIPKFTIRSIKRKPGQGAGKASTLAGVTHNSITVTHNSITVTNNG